MRSAQLRDIARLDYGFAFDSKRFNADGRGLPLVRIRDLVPGRSGTYYSGDYADRYIVNDGDYLIGMDGQFNLARWRGGRALLNQRVCRVGELDGSLDRGYLARFLPLALKIIEDATPFVTVKHLSAKALNAIQVPLPPLPEQRRIAAILDRADAIRTKRRQALAHLDSLTQSIFHDMFGEISRRTRLGDLATTTSGGTPNRAVSANYGGEIPWVKSGELHAGLVTETEERISELGLASSSAKLLPAGTVLLAMYGATAGVVGRLGIDAATNQAICCITPGPELDAEYLVAALRAQTGALVAKAAGGAQPNLSQGIVRDFDIPVPSITYQQRFAECVKAIESRRSSVVRAFAADNELFNSLQERAFRGEL